MTTPKTLRAAPAQVFENYVALKVTDENTSLFPLSLEQMNSLDNFDYFDSLSGFVFEGYKEVSLGFDLKFDEKVYDKVVVGLNGWALIREKNDLTTFDPADFWAAGNALKTAILDDFLSSGVLFCPWFDKSTLQVPTLDILETSSLVTTETKEKIEKGILPYPEELRSRGSVFYKKTSSDRGVCFVIRWNLISAQPDCIFSEGLGNFPVISFECIFYENGLIEFRYDKKENIFKNGEYVLTHDDYDGVSGACLGVFNNYPEMNFRDLGVGLGHPSDATRTLSENGGSVYDPSFSEVDYDGNGPKPFYISLYCAKLDPGFSYSPDPSFTNMRADNWPASYNNCCIISFSPPQRKRKVLPRVKAKKSDNRTSLPLKLKVGGSSGRKRKADLFDDKKSISFSRNIDLNYPAGIPNDFVLSKGLGSRNVLAKQSVNLLGDFIAKGDVTKLSVDEFLFDETEDKISPYRDHDRPEQQSFSSFYMTGSSIEEFGLDFKSSLRAKTHISFELPLENTVELPGTTSSIYYYNKNEKSFELKNSDDLQNALLALPGTGSGGENFFTNLDWGKYRPEDARGFGPIGNYVSSGSSSPDTLPYPLEEQIDYGERLWSSDSDFQLTFEQYIFGSEDSFLPSQRAKFLSKKYDKSLQLNEEYSCNPDNVLEFQSENPFLVEKVFVEIPFSAGPGWFLDKTVTTTPIASSTVESLNGENGQSGLSWECSDFAGPGITFSIFNNIFSSSFRQMDLVAKATIIPSGDNISNISVKQSWTDLFLNIDDDDSALNPISIFELEGFKGYKNKAEKVVEPDETLSFEGKIGFEMTPAITNGLYYTLFKICPFVSISAGAFGGDQTTDVASTDSLNSEQFISFFSNPFVNLSRDPSTILDPSAVDFPDEFKVMQFSALKTVDPFGRNGKGTELSGRSLFGNEYTVPQNDDSSIPNPMFVAEKFDDFPVALKNILDTSINPGFKGVLTLTIPIESEKESPYLLMPGDKLSFAISKMRPALYSNSYDPVTGAQSLPYWRGDLEHDVQIPPGSIKITLYGSNITQGKEYNNTLEQPLSTNALSEVIGDHPVLDQFDVEYQSSLFGSYTENYMTGSLRESVLDETNFCRGDRGRAFNRLLAGVAPLPDESAYELNANPLKSFRLQPWSEKVGDIRNVTLITDNETFYDSLVPDIQESFSRLGMEIYKVPDPTTYIMGSLDADESKIYSSVKIEDSWFLSHPFESIFSGIQRNKGFNTKFKLEKEFTGVEFPFVPPSLSDLGETCFSNIFLPYSSYSIFSGLISRFRVFCDKNLSSEFVTKKIVEMSEYDLSKSLFGFYSRKNILNEDIALFSIPLSYYFFNFRGRETIKDDTVGLVGSASLASFSPIIDSWKYGLVSGIPTNTQTTFRRDHYGQFRDMLEQRPYTRFFVETNLTGRNQSISTITEGPVKVKFVNSRGQTTAPQSTFSQNLSMYCTSSLPYFDGQAKNREEPINTDQLNSVIFTMLSDDEIIT